MKPLIEELPRHYQRSAPDAELQRVLSLLVEQAQADEEFTLAQLFPSTTSGWGLEVSGEYRYEIWFTDTIGEIAHKQDLVDIVNELKPAHLDWAIKYRKEIETPILVGALARQGDSMILWEVDCRNDP